jgi:hypothetical protein
LEREIRQSTRSHTGQSEHGQRQVSRSCATRSMSLEIGGT